MKKLTLVARLSKEVILVEHPDPRCAGAHCVGLCESDEDDKRYRIFIKSGLSDKEKAVTFFHELTHLVIQWHTERRAEEQICDDIARAAILALIHYPSLQSGVAQVVADYLNQEGICHKRRRGSCGAKKR